MFFLENRGERGDEDAHINEISNQQLLLLS